MIYRILRHLTVQYRIVGGFMVILSLITLSIPLVHSINISLTSRLQQLTNVDAKIDRSLLLTSRQILLARVNLLRYSNDLVPSPAEAHSNIAVAIQLLTEVEGLVSSKEESASVGQVIEGLKSYDLVIRDIQAARKEGREADVSALISKAVFFGNDAELQVDKILRKSESRIATANQEVIKETRTRLTTFLWGYVFILFLAILVGYALERTIIRPVSELQAGAEYFRSSRQASVIPEDGNDELTSLARSFNQLTDELSKLYQSLEQQVTERTLALRASFQVAQHLASIMDPQELVVSVVEEVKNAFGYYHVHIYLLDDAKENLVMVGGTGEAGEAMLRQGHKIARGKGLVGRAAENNDVVLVQDTTEDPGWLPNPLLPETNSEIAVPIAIVENVLGVLDVQENRKDGFSEQDVELLKAIANQTALAVQNTRLYSMAQRQVENEVRVSEISQKIQSATSIESVLQIALRDLGEALGASRGCIQIRIQPGDGNN